jgi:hypothetical protein
MPDRPDPPIDDETIARFAKEQVKITLTHSEVGAVKTLLDGLLDEIGQISLRDRGSAEPETSIIVQEWPT